MSGRAFLTWSPCGRSRWQAHNLGAELLLVRPAVRLPGSAVRLAVRYAASALATWRALSERRPAVVFSANMPVFLPLTAWLYASLAHVPLVLDCHSGAFNHPRWRWARFLNRFLAKRAAVSVTTNAHHRALVERWGGRALIMGDVPLAPRLGGAAPPLRRPAIAAVCSYSFDEPVEAIVAAAALRPEVSFYVTGDPAKLRRRVLGELPPNVIATGFLPDADYYALLAAADGVLVLTTRDHTMQRGAYEALYLGTPIVTSHWQLLREVFGEAALYVDNSPEDIARAVSALVRDPACWRARAAARGAERRQVYARALDDLNARLAVLASEDRG